MMGLEAGVDEGVLQCLGLDDRQRRWVCSSGNSLAEGWSEPFLQKSGFFGPRTAAANHTRPFWSNIALWLLTLVS